MNYIIFDMEWNQARSKREYEERELQLAGEIIEIGAVKLDEKFRFVDTFRIYIKPKYYAKMNRRVSKLTGITDADLENALPFPKAFRHFKRFCGRKFAFMTWGNDDIRVLEENMAMHGIDEKWIPQNYNLQIIYDMQVSNTHKQCALNKAMETLGERSFLNEHDALNDAENTVLVLRHLDMQRGFEEYDRYHPETPKSVLKKERLHCYDGPSEKILSAAKIQNFRCPLCEEEQVCHPGEFYETPGDVFISSAKCDAGHELFVRVRLQEKKDKGRRRWVMRTLYTLNDDKRKLLADAATPVDTESDSGPETDPTDMD